MLSRTPHPTLAKASEVFDLYLELNAGNRADAQVNFIADILKMPIDREELVRDYFVVDFSNVGRNSQEKKRSDS